MTQVLVSLTNLPNAVFQMSFKLLIKINFRAVALQNQACYYIFISHSVDGVKTLLLSISWLVGARWS